jgi:CBS domain-containing protein
MENRPLHSFRDFFASVRVREEDSLEQVVSTVLEHPGFHDVCVVNDGGYLLGVINIKKLFRTIFFHHADPHLMTRQLIELASSEIAGHIMVSDPLVCLETESLDNAIGKMVQHDLGELPVIDEQRKLLGSLSMNLVFGFWLEGEKGRPDSGSPF